MREQTKGNSEVLKSGKVIKRLFTTPPSEILTDVGLRACVRECVYTWTESDGPDGEWSAQ